MGILIDSSVLIQLERADMDMVDFVKDRQEEEAFLSVISASELLHGVHRAEKAEIKARRLAFVERVLVMLPVLDIDLNTARSHAELWATLSHSGKMIGAHDMWIAATCLAHSLSLATHNSREFHRVPGLMLEAW